MAWLQVLLHLLVFNADTNLVSRGGLAGLDYVRGYSRQLLLDGGVFVRNGLKKMATFDDELIMRNLSPGGSADLLAVTVFLANLPTGGSASIATGDQRTLQVQSQCSTHRDAGGVVAVGAFDGGNLSRTV